MTTTSSLNEHLEDLLVQAGLSNQANLVAMHLTEIEDEAANLLDQLTAFRAHARHGDAEAAQEAMVEVSLALQHIADHIQAAVPILDAELDIDGDD